MSENNTNFNSISQMTMGNVGSPMAGKPPQKKPDIKKYLPFIILAAAVVVAVVLLIVGIKAVSGKNSDQSSKQGSKKNSGEYTKADYEAKAEDFMNAMLVIMCSEEKVSREAVETLGGKMYPKGAIQEAAEKALKRGVVEGVAFQRELREEASDEGYSKEEVREVLDACFGVKYRAQKCTKLEKDELEDYRVELNKRFPDIEELEIADGYVVTMKAEYSKIRGNEFAEYLDDEGLGGSAMGEEAIGDCVLFLVGNKIGVYILMEEDGEENWIFDMNQ